MYYALYIQGLRVYVKFSSEEITFKPRIVAESSQPFCCCFDTADGCRHWERHSGAMEAQAQWAGKLLQEYQRRAEASGFPGPHPEASQPTKDTPAKTVQGMSAEFCLVIGNLMLL